MYTFPKQMQKLIAELGKLPSVGEKSATRLAYHLVTSGTDLARQLSDTLKDSVDKINLCRKCFYLTEDELCIFCSNSSRTDETICVVEKPMDLVAIERVGEYRGLYHVLHGVWSPLHGKGADNIKLTELLERISTNGETKEVILATSTTVEGDATAMYVAKEVGALGINTSRLAQGVPKGGELEYLDDITLARALEGRRRLLTA